MPFVEKRLISPTSLTTSASTALYTVPTGYTAIIKQIVVTNTTGTAATFTMYIGAASAGNALFSGTSVAANDTVIINLSQVLGTGEILRALSGTNAALNLTVSGVENDGPLAQNAMYIADNAITSAKIADGAIVNTDINASAAIDKTKISGTAVTVADTGTVTSTMILDGTIATADIAANAVTQAKLSTDISLSGMRNVLINGDMRINQRGASYTSIGYTLDRWYLGVTGAYTVSQSTSTPPANFQNFMRVQRTNGSTNTAVPQIAHSLETSASIPLQGKQVTVSFYARAGANYSPTSSTLNYRIYGGTGTDQNIFSYTGQAIVNDLSVTLTTSWQRFTYTTSALTSYNEYGLFFFCNPTGTAGANDYFDITGVQLEVGPQATPFEQRPYGVELSLCKRYYQEVRYVTETGPLLHNLGVAWSANVYKWITAYFPVTMRVEPTVTTESGAGAGFDAKIRYITTTQAGSGVDRTPYSVVSKVDRVVVKSYSEANDVTHYGINGGYRAEAEL